MKTKAVAFILSLCLVFLICGCSPDTNSSLPNTGKANADETLRNPNLDKFMYGIMNQEAYDTINSFIDTIEFPYLPWRSGFMYCDAKDAIDRLGELDIAETTVLISEELKCRDSTSGETLQKGEALYIAARVNMRVASYSKLYRVYGENDVLKFRIEDVYPLSQKILKETEKSNKSAEEKLRIYQDFGIWSVPYVKKELKKGNFEFEKYFILIGAHVSTKEFCELTEIVNTKEPIPTIEERNAALLASAEGFDYKAWLSENEEDLENLFTYLDAYCAEYEETNK